MDITVIPPDSAGSRGDEAVVRGALTVLSGANITLLTPNNPHLSWGSELLDLAGTFSEKMVNIEDLENTIIKSTVLVVLGTDTIDGTENKESSMCRLAAIEKNKQLGGKSLVFMSFKHDVSDSIVSKIKSIGDCPDSVLWFCRDSDSIKNFVFQCGLRCEYFPDFAFFVKSNSSERSKKVIRVMEEIESGKYVVGINLCHHAFISFYSYDIDNVVKYVQGVINSVKSELGSVVFIFIPNDVRQWGGI